MKNAMQSQVKKCICKDYDEFKLDVLAALGNDVKLTYDLEGLYFECHEEPLSTEEILAGMSKYYGVKVTSIHIDDCETVGVWICYHKYDNRQAKKYNFYQVSVWHPAESGCEDAYERDVLVVAKSKKNAVKKAKIYLEAIGDCSVEDEVPYRIEAVKLHGIPMWW